MKLLTYLKRRFFCKHKMKSVEESPWYFHEKCDKCGYECGAGNFNIK